MYPSREARVRQVRRWRISISVVLISLEVRFGYAPVRVLAPSCQGNPDCRQTVTAALIVSAKIVDPTAPRALVSAVSTDDRRLQNRLDAAARGDVCAQFSLGAAYESGESVSQDYALAWKWYRAASDQGHVKAQSTLGRLYAHGRGGDYCHAFMWLSIAAERGSIVASDNRAKIEKKMSGDELRAAATLLEQCRSRNFIKYE